MKDNNAEHADQIFQRIAQFLLSNPRADISQLHHPEAPGLVQLSSRKAGVHPETASAHDPTQSHAFCFPATLTIE